MSLIGTLIALAFISIVAGTFVKARISHAERMARARQIAPTLSEKGRSALSAHQHYLDCNQPDFILAELLPQALITETSQNRYGITELGKCVGIELGLFDDPAMVITF
jgi:hypothetical protein